MSRNAAKSGRKRRWPWWLLFAGLGLAAIFYLGGGWYFSGQIHSGGLVPEAPERNFDVTIESIDGDTVVLAGDDDAIDDPGVYALHWDGGFALIGGIESIDTQGVHRTLTAITGTQPPMTPEEVDLDSWIYPTDPSDAGLTFEDVTYTSSLGEMDAWYVPAGDAPADTWAIHAHGWRTDRREMLRTLPTFHEAGIDSLVIEYRNDQGAPTDPSGLYRFGRTEWQDIEAAVQYSLDHGAERVILVGFSTGATGEFAFLEQSEISDSVVGVVFDSPNIDFGRAVKTEAQQTTLIPGLPFTVPDSLTATAMFIADERFDIGWKAIDYVGHQHALTVPVLIFHGDADGTVPLSVSTDLAAAYPNLVTLVVTPDADHVRSWNVDPGGYEEQLQKFLSAL
jgi:pimeloyl-ACP methyl ester carboxylesterase